MLRGRRMIGPVILIDEQELLAATIIDAMTGQM
jgi:hypothetical protein